MSALGVAGVGLQRDGRVATLTLAKPPLNVLDLATLEALALGLAGLARDPQLDVLVVRGAGERAFCAGVAVQDHVGDRIGPAVAAFHGAIRTLRELPAVTMAVVHGHCLGGGLELALTCDLRIAAHGVKLGMPPAKLGLIYSHTGLQKFIDAVGPARTRELFFVGRNVDAERAEQIGLVNEVVQPDSINESAVALAAEIAGNAPVSLKGNKEIIGKLVTFRRLSETDEQNVIDLRLSSFGTHDFREGVRAFGEKRKPHWEGR